MALQSAYFKDWKWGSSVLLWGDAEGMRGLAEFLRREAAGSTNPSFREYCQAVDGKVIDIQLVTDPRDTGMHFVEDRLEWKLQTALSQNFAAKVEMLTRCDRGHQYLDGDANEVGVLVSIGEYPLDLRPAPKIDADTKAAMRKRGLRPGSVKLTSSALSQIRAFMQEVRRRKPEENWIASIEWATGRKKKRPHDAEWSDLPDSLMLGCYRRSELSPDLIDKIDDMEIVFSASDPSILVGKTIDCRDGQFFFAA